MTHIQTGKAIDKKRELNSLFFARSKYALSNPLTDIKTGNLLIKFLSIVIIDHAKSQWIIQNDVVICLFEKDLEHSSTKDRKSRINWIADCKFNPKKLNCLQKHLFKHMGFLASTHFQY